MLSRRVTRRRFVQSLAVAGASLPLLHATTARAAGGKLNVASVGVGGKGWSDLLEITSSPHVNVVALCDIDEGPQHLGRAAEKFSGAQRYTDWRKLLEQRDIEAVHIATPDHMHAPVALAAIQLGKHVYCQKPLTHTVAEARKLRLAAEQAGVVTQMGNQIQSHDAYRTAVRLVHDGAIGKVKEVFSWQSGSPKWPRAIERPAGVDAVPAGVHWNEWLGVAPERPYKTGMYHPFNWRGWQDFGTGQLGDFGCHILDPVFMALGLSAPTALKADAPPINAESWTKWATVEYDFPGTQYTAGPLKLTWYDGEGVFPPRDALGLPADFKLPAAGSLLIGEQGSLLIPHVAAPKLFPVEKFQDYQLPKLDPVNHYTSWADACRGEGKTTSHFGYSGLLTETVLLGTIGVRRPGETLSWDTAAMRFTNSPAADRMLTKAYRAGWNVPGLG
jgi:predicted dehydrogenase